MKVLRLNGSIHAEGNTRIALKERAKEFSSLGIESEIFQIGTKPVRDCLGCGQCKEEGCIFNDDVCNEFIKKAKHSDGFVFASPVYYAHPSGRILSLLDRAFYSCGKAFAFKPCASIAVARRGGTSTTFDVLNKYATIANRFVVGSTYWNNVFGCRQGEAKKDREGLQTRRNLAKNRAYLLFCLKAGEKAGAEKPSLERENRLNFIH